MIESSIYREAFSEEFVKTSGKRLRTWLTQRKARKIGRKAEKRYLNKIRARDPEVNEIISRRNAAKLVAGTMGGAYLGKRLYDKAPEYLSRVPGVQPTARYISSVPQYTQTEYRYGR